MKIGDVYGENFAAFEKVGFNLSDKGLVLLVGDNKDDTSAISNGAGKSETADLICWTLWGTTARGSKGDSVIRRGQKKVIGIVKLHESDAEEWTIERTRTKGKETLSLKQQMLDATNTWIRSDHTLGTLALTQLAIQKVLGCTEDVFRAAIYVGQEDLPDLPAMTDKPLKEMIERASGVDVLERALAEAKTRLSQAEKSAAVKAGALEILKAQIIGVQSRRDDAATNEKQWKVDHLAQTITIEQDATFYAERHLKLAAELAASVDSAKFAAGISMLDTKIKTLDAEVTEKTRLDRAVVTAQANVTQAARDVAIELRTVVGIGTELAQLQGRLGTPCVECGTTLTDDHLVEVKTATEARQTLAQAAHTTAVDRHTKALTALTEAQGALDKHVAGMHDSTKLYEQKTKLMLALKEREQKDKTLIDLRASMTKVEQELVAHKAAINPHTAVIGTHDLTLISLVSQRNAEEVILGELLTAIDHAKVVVQVFGPSGVRAHMLDEVTPYLNERTAEYLSTMSDGNITAVWNTLTKNKKGEYKERFAIDVAYQEGGDFNDLSGGQKRKVRIACALALQDLVASRATKPFDLWIADEIDSALDSAGLERLMMVLQTKAKERGTVVVISHSDLKSWIPNVWTVTLENKVSTLATT